MPENWGIVSTIKAPTRDILDFAAYHLDLGAHRLYLYLDEPSDAQTILAAHPKIKVTYTDATYWEKRNGRPEKHQARQSMNARHAYNRRAEVAWLAHIDVDEFLWPDTDVASALATLPDDCGVARIRPIEALSDGDGTEEGETAFKAFHLDQSQRNQAATKIFGPYAQHLSGGFLSHVAGKLFMRTGKGRPRIKIHNAEFDGVSNPGETALPQIQLCHMHAKSWEDWMRTYRYRLDKGSYRSELKAQVRQNGAMNLHDLFLEIEKTDGETGLRRFYERVCAGSRELCEKLESEGLLRKHRLNLDEKRAKHFPSA